MSRPLFAVLLSVLLIVSGAAGLSYEVVWLRSLSNALGSSSTATAMVLAVFMAGMAAGSLFLGRIADRFRRPLLLYAVLEAALAICALSLPAALKMVEKLDSVFSDADSSSLLFTKGLVAALILFVPTFIMGGTLPAVAAALSRRGLKSGSAFSWLYGLHVLGAASGALIASFWMIGRYGLSGTSDWGALLNLLVAVGTFALSRSSAGIGESSEADAAKTDAAGDASGQTSSLIIPVIATVFLTGFTLLGSEVVFVRILVMALMARVHSFALMLAVFLVGLSIGSFLAGFITRKAVQSNRLLGYVMVIGAGGLLIGRLAPLRWALDFLIAAFGVDPSSQSHSGAFASIARILANDQPAIQPQEYVVVSLAISAICLLPFAIPLGMVLPLALRRVAFSSSDPGRATGRIIFWNTVGSVLGPLVTSFVLVPWLSLQGTLWLFALLVLAAGCAWLAPTLRLHWRLGTGISLTAMLAVAVFLAGSDPRFEGTPELDLTRVGQARAFGATELPEVLHHEEGASGTVTVVERADGKRTIRLDGFQAAGTPDEGSRSYHYMKVMAHLPALLRGPLAMKKALVICCGTGGTAGSISLYPVEEVELVDLHPEVLSCLSWFDDWNRGLADKSICAKIADDGRAHLRRRKDYYDVITLEPMPPHFAGMTQLYSVEFYEACSRALREGGLVCQWLPLHLMSREDGLGLTRSMAEAFKTVQIWEHAATMLLVGTDREELPFAKEHFDQMMSIPEVRADLTAANLSLPLAFADAFHCEAGDLDAALGAADLLHDDHPWLEYKEVSYELTEATARQMAERRKPFLEGRLRAMLRLEGFGAEIERPWKVLSIIHYARLLGAAGRLEEAREFLVDEMKKNPGIERFPGFMPQVRGLLERQEIPR